MTTLRKRKDVDNSFYVSAKKVRVAFDVIYCEVIETQDSGFDKHLDPLNMLYLISLRYICFI